MESGNLVLECHECLIQYILLDQLAARVYESVFPNAVGGIILELDASVTFFGFQLKSFYDKIRRGKVQ